MSTRFNNIRKKTNQELQKKLQFFTKKFTASLVYLFLGFLIGNLFGTLIDFFRLILWDGFIIVTIILLFEGINFFNYSLKWEARGDLLFTRRGYVEDKSKTQSSFDSGKSFSETTNSRPRSSLMNFFIFFVKSLNYLKLGILLGFFIDAFKVGS